MRTCQNCAAPIPTAARRCDQCQAEQLPTVGGDAARVFPEVFTVVEENTELDRRIARFSLISLLGSSFLISIISGVSVGSLMIGTSTFFVALLALYVLFQVVGIDLSI